MKQIAGFIVKYSKVILALFIIAAAASGWLAAGVAVNTDMSKYLPDDSSTKEGIGVMDAEFPPATTFNLMIEGLAADERDSVAETLMTVPHVTGVVYDDTEAHNKDGYSLYVIQLGVSTYSDEAREAVQSVKDRFADYTIFVNGDAAWDAAMDVLPMMFSMAFVILLIILLILCASWVEPFLFLASIGVAVVLNMGTNAIFDSVSSTTNSIAAILQLCLSMDYSIMLLSRYRREKLNAPDKAAAMKNAINGAFVAISSSSATTIVGMLALALMSFTIGRDMGFVLAKGVFFSLLCNFTVLPALVLMFDRAVEKTAKKSPRFKTDKIASGSYKLRRAVPVVFLALFVGGFFLRGNIGISYTMTDYHKVNEIFTLDNPVVVLYERADEAAIAPLTEKWAADPAVTGVDAYATTLGAELTAREFAETFGFDAAMAAQLYSMYGGGTDTIALYELIVYLADNIETNPLFQRFITDEQREQLAGAKAQMDEGISHMLGDEYGRVVIHTGLPEESGETFAFMDSVVKDLSELPGKSYILGNSATANEMNGTFPGEMNRITIITVAVIFAVVLIAFRSAAVPLILVCIVQCAVFITMGAAHLQAGSIFYLPLLIVQCLLLGATVDYGILLASCYREERKTAPVRDALIAALNHSIHTIMTSGLILITVTGFLGVFLGNSDPAISQILITIAIGGLTAALLVIFILPGVLSALDRFVTRKKDRA